MSLVSGGIGEQAHRVVEAHAEHGDEEVDGVACYRSN
jgi:hypothetical protein